MYLGVCWCKNFYRLSFQIKQLKEYTPHYREQRRGYDFRACVFEVVFSAAATPPILYSIGASSIAHSTCATRGGSKGVKSLRPILRRVLEIVRLIEWVQTYGTPPRKGPPHFGFCRRRRYLGGDPAISPYCSYTHESEESKTKTNRNRCARLGRVRTAVSPRLFASYISRG